MPAQAKQEEPACAAKPSSHVNSKDWSRMMAIVYNIDVLECPRCQSRNRSSCPSKAKSATITQPKAAISLLRRILILNHKLFDNQDNFDPRKTDF